MIKTKDNERFEDQISVLATDSSATQRSNIWLLHKIKFLINQMGLILFSQYL